MENVYLNRITWNENIYTIPENKESKKKKKNFQIRIIKLQALLPPPPTIILNIPGGECTLFKSRITFILTRLSSKVTMTGYLYLEVYWKVVKVLGGLRPRRTKLQHFQGWWSFVSQSSSWKATNQVLSALTYFIKPSYENCMICFSTGAMVLYYSSQIVLPAHCIYDHYQGAKGKKCFCHFIFLVTTERGNTWLRSCF